MGLSPNSETEFKEANQDREDKSSSRCLPAAVNHGGSDPALLAVTQTN